MRIVTHPRQSAAIVWLAGGISCLFLASAFALRGATHHNLGGIAIGLAFALFIFLLRAATLPGALLGGLLTATLSIGTVAAYPGDWQHSALPPLIALLVLALVATHYRRNVKEALGVAEARSGRRAAQVCANLGAAALAASASIFPVSRTVILMAVAAAFVEAVADTVSSEIGQALRGKAVLITTGRTVAPGTDGGISISGTLAGCIAGVLVAKVAAASLSFTASQALACWLAGTVGIFFDSWLGATLERRRRIGNDTVNFASTVFSALLAVIAWYIFFR